jgi:amidophosphoribosyltransferase
MEFYLVCTDVETGKPVYHLCDNDGDYEMLEWFRASGSMPMVSRVVELGGYKLLDGGLSDSIPLRFMEEQGYERNVVILTRPAGYAKHSSKMMGVMSRALKDYPETVKALENRHVMYNQEVAYVRKREAGKYALVIRPDSDIDGCNVHAFRKESGKLLFKEAPADADIVIGVPDSSLSAAIGYAEASGIPYEMGLVKSKYVARTFIQPSQSMREKGVRMKLSAVRSIVGGKRVVMVDDSIVRGTTSKRIVRLLKEAGATEVHVRIGSPAMKHPCYYGVDTSTYEELISARLDVEQVREYIGADSLAFLSTEALMKSGDRKEMCMACFDGNYPTDLYQTDEEESLYKRYQIKVK